MKRELATKDEAMKRELAAKDEIIQAKDDRIADLEKLADERLHRIAELRRIIDSTGIDIHGFPFPVGTAEGKKKQAKHP
jgi:tagatose-1,6-bisphosphate aldolase